MNWERVLRKYGWNTEEVGNDPFHPLDLQAQQARVNQQSVARVSMTAGTAADYGSVKVTCSVSVDCPQTDASISLAGEAAFMKCLELVNDGAEFLGIQPLSRPT